MFACGMSCEFCIRACSLTRACFFFTHATIDFDFFVDDDDVDGDDDGFRSFCCGWCRGKWMLGASCG